MQELNLAPAVVFPIKDYPYEVTSDFITLKRTLKVKELEDTLRKYGGGKGFAIKVNNGTIAPREFQRPESWKNKHRKNAPQKGPAGGLATTNRKVVNKS